MVEYKSLTECVETAAENEIETIFSKQSRFFFSDREDEAFEIVMEEDENSSDDEIQKFLADDEIDKKIILVLPRDTIHLRHICWCRPSFSSTSFPGSFISPTHIYYFFVSKLS